MEPKMISINKLSLKVTWYLNWWTLFLNLSPHNLMLRIKRARIKIEVTTRNVIVFIGVYTLIVTHL
jgi:hypothetical protein